MPSASKSKPALDYNLLLSIFETALLSRRFEERIIQMSLAGEIPATLHPGAGQETGQVAAIAALGPDDKVLYGHRGLAYWLARGVSMEAILADIANRVGGTNNGKGGAMHVVDVPHGVLGESGTVGGGFVISVGVGMALKRAGKGQVVMHFFGDGTSNRGTFHESLNWAALQKLPCVYVCENNGFAVSVPTSVSTSVADIASRATGYGVPGVVVDGSDAAAVYEVAREAVDRARAGKGPTLIESKLTRLMGHYIGDQQLYRADRDQVAGKDPLPKLQKLLEDAGALTAEKLAAMESDFKARIESAVTTVMAAPLLPRESAFQDLYA
jgi:pyruvate dehydrogenase E1 component alpha subunit